MEETPGLVAHWRFEEAIDPRLDPEKKGTRVEVEEEAMKGLFFPGGAMLKLSARVHDAARKIFKQQQKTWIFKMDLI